MEADQVIVANLPVWTLWVVAIAQIIFALAIGAIAVALIILLGTIKDILRSVNHDLPSIMKNVDGTLSNVKAMSDDAQTTVGHVTHTANHITGVVGTVTNSLESPIFKAVGMVAGAAAGARTFLGNKKDKSTKKGGGRFGFGKK